MVEGTGADAGEPRAMLEQDMADLVRLKRTEPGQDIVTGMVRDPANLDDEEMTHNVLSLYRSRDRTAAEPDRHFASAHTRR